MATAEVMVKVRMVVVTAVLILVTTEVMTVVMVQVTGVRDW